MNSNKRRKGQIHFNGFERPESNFFRLPNSWTDMTALLSSLAEIKVVEYVLRHTWGYHEFGVAKKITTDEFMRGRKRQDGNRVDKGTGLSNRAVIDGLRLAVEHGLLLEEIDRSDRARIKKYYSLRMLASSENAGEEGGAETNHGDVNFVHTGVNNLHSSYEELSQRTGKETIERNQKKNTVNGVVKGGERSVLQQLPDMGDPPDKTEYVARDIILKALGAALSTSSLLDELPERRPMTVVLVSGAWRQYCCATA